MYLNNNAANIYLETTIVAFRLNLICLSEYIKRLSTLKLLVLPNSYFNDYLEEFDDIDWDHDERKFDGDERRKALSIEDGKDLNRAVLNRNNRSDDDILYFCRNGKLDWEFHKGDADPIPSIPHGHSWDRKEKMKLDPYRGGIYNVKKKKRVDKEIKQFIVSLWNEDGFRTFTLEALTHYIATYPYYDIKKERGLIGDPLLLPNFSRFHRKSMFKKR